MERWAGKIAVVTGASSGIGAAIAKDLADYGVVVVAVARRLDRLQKLAQTTKGKLYAKQCDLRKEVEILALFRWVENTLGGVDILVNNAAVANAASLMTGETDKWQEIMDTNVKAVNICTREALKSMRQRGDNGHIFHINSLAGHAVKAYLGRVNAMYKASKFAITALTEALRLELILAKSSIRITSISPGVVKTELGGQDFRTALVKVPTLEPEDISEGLIYALKTKSHVQVHELTIQPLGSDY